MEYFVIISSVLLTEFAIFCALAIVAFVKMFFGSTPDFDHYDE